jgi:hypothetical protein
MKSCEGLDGVVWGTVGMRRVERRDTEAGVRKTRESEHGDTVSEGSGCAVGLERLAAYRGKEDFVQIEGVGGSGGDRNVAVMGRVEGSAEEGYAHGIFSLE